jgi:CheY-like chemotaxis protein
MTTAPLPDLPDKTWFTRELRTALTSLYDPYVLRHSPLAKLLGVDQQRQPIFALRRVLTDAIETLRPGKNTPIDSRSWRVYQVLRRRYIEQASQRELALALGLSIRQLQREEKRAREILADELWTTYELESKVREFASNSSGEREDDPARTPDQPHPRVQELEWLQKSVSPQIVNAEEIILDVLKTIHPLLLSSGVTIHHKPRAILPPLFTKALLLRQAVLNLLTMAVRDAPGGEISIWTEAFSSHLAMNIQAVRGAALPANGAAGETIPDEMQMTEQLIQLCNGSLETRLNRARKDVFTATISLPVAEQTILVIDDNADTRRLFQRYLASGHYHFVGAETAEAGLTLARELTPQLILLDVMMPGRDGWTALGQLREHPQTQHIPIIVCSIVSQRELALALGAVAFLRKPVSREDLLAALNHWVDSQ